MAALMAAQAAVMAAGAEATAAVAAAGNGKWLTPMQCNFSERG